MWITKGTETLENMGNHVVTARWRPAENEETELTQRAMLHIAKSWGAAEALIRCQRKAGGECLAVEIGGLSGLWRGRAAADGVEKIVLSWKLHLHGRKDVEIVKDYAPMWRSEPPRVPECEP